MTTNFKGTTPAMNGHVFECYDEQSDRRQFTKTVKALESHVKKTMKNPEDLASLFAPQPSLPVLTKPPKPLALSGKVDNPPDEGDLEVWKQDLRELSKRKQVLRGNMAAIHAVVRGQCSKAMKAKLRSLASYEEKTREDNCNWLMKSIMAITMQFDEKHDRYISMLDAIGGFVNCRQQRDQTVTSYIEALRSFTDTIEYHGGSILLNPDLVPERVSNGRVLSEAERKQIGRDCTFAAAAIRGSDRTRFGSLQTSLKNQFSNGEGRISSRPNVCTCSA